MSARWFEGGGQVLGQAFDAGLVDEVQFYFTPLLAGGGIAAVAGTGGALPRGQELCNCRYERLGPDVLLAGEVTRFGV